MEDWRYCFESRTFRKKYIVGREAMHSKMCDRIASCHSDVSAGWCKSPGMKVPTIPMEACSASCTPVDESWLAVRQHRNNQECRRSYGRIFMYQFFRIDWENEPRWKYSAGLMVVYCKGGLSLRGPSEFRSGFDSRHYHNTLERKGSPKAGESS